MFLVGETVIYGATGVCKISDISENKLTGKVREYYVLRPVDTDKSVIYVPTDNEKLVSRMRQVPSANELTNMLSDIKGESIPFIENNLERNDVYHAILNDGDIKEIVKLFRTLHSRQLELAGRGKHLPKADERLYKDCSRLLCSELNTILNLENSEILSLLVEC